MKIKKITYALTAVFIIGTSFASAEKSKVSIPVPESSARPGEGGGNGFVVQIKNDERKKSSAVKREIFLKRNEKQEELKGKLKVTDNGEFSLYTIKNQKKTFVVIPAFPKRNYIRSLQEYGNRDVTLHGFYFENYFYVTDINGKGNFCKNPPDEHKSGWHKQKFDKSDGWSK